jgi:hypothetical protein
MIDTTIDATNHVAATGDTSAVSTRRTGINAPGDDTIAIAALLLEAGLDTPAAARTARRALEAVGLTNPRKQGIAAYKRQSALDLLAKRFALVCSEACLALASGGRTPVISRKGCEVCGGSNNRRAMIAAGRALQANGVRRVLIIGGKEEQHRELAAIFGKHGVGVQGVVGTSRSHSQKDALANMRRADLMVIWANTELRHAVSEHYTTQRPPELRVVTPSRRSIEALCDAIVHTFARRGGR